MASIAFPSSLVKLEHNSFKDCARLSQNRLSIPETVVEISDVGIYRFDSIPSSLSSIGKSTFEDANVLNGNVELTNDNIYIGENAFSGNCTISSMHMHGIDTIP